MHCLSSFLGFCSWEHGSSWHAVVAFPNFTQNFMNFFALVPQDTTGPELGSSLSIAPIWQSSPRLLVFAPV